MSVLKLAGGPGLIVGSASISVALLVTAFGFQHIGGLAPCALCLTQRWAHVALIAVAGLALCVRGAALAAPALLTGCLAGLASAGIAGFHAGVEYGWWEGLQSCSGGVEDLAAMSGEELLSTIMAAPIVKCSEVAWSFAGLSMAGWNAVISLLITGLWIATLCLHMKKGDP